LDEYSYYLINKEDDKKTALKYLEEVREVKW